MASQPIRILHVDDSPEILEVTATGLEKEDSLFEIRSAEGPEKALDILAEEPIDCIVSDYDMPEQNGIELLETVREDAPALPFILYTGKGSEAVASDAISAGVTDYLQKEGGTSHYAVLANRIANAVEQYRSRRQLEASRERLSLFFEQSPLGVVEWDEEFNFVRLNDAAEEILGYDQSDLVGDSWERIVPESETADVQTVVDALLDTEGGYRSVNKNLTASGEQIICEWHNRLITDDDGEVVTIFSQFQDVTDREEHRRQLETVIDNLPGYVYRHRNEEGWPLEFVKGSSEDVTGYTPAELEDISSAEEIIHPEDREYVRDATAEGLAEEERYDLTYRISTKDDEVRWIWERGKLVENPVTGDHVLEGFITGITDRKERERVLRGMYEVFADRDSTFQEQMEALLDIGRQTLDTKYGTLSHIDGGDYLFEVVSTADDSVQAGDVVPVEATNCEIVANTQETVVLGDVERDAPGETDRAGFADWGISCYIGAPVYDGDGVYGTFCFYDTEARTGQFSDWEQTLVELMSSWVSYELERRESNKQLQQQNERLEQFASIVSHDLRNPLNVATLRLELAQRDCESDNLDAVEQAHSRMERLIDDLLTLARQGEVAISKEPMDIAAVVEDSWANVETGEATLNRHVSGTVLADDGRLKQVFENLFRNAIEHAGDDAVVTVGELDDGFYVEDDGPGIPAEKRETVFEAGYSTDPEGTGFGLRIVEQVVEAHDLEIAVVDGNDGGARFEISGLESIGY